MRIVKILKDKSLNEDERFFADLIKDEFGCNACTEEITNPNYLKVYARPLNDFNIYTTAQPTSEGVRMLGWRKFKSYQQ